MVNNKSNNSCLCPPKIRKECLNPCKNFDLTRNCVFCLLKKKCSCLIQKQGKGVTVSRGKSGLVVESDGSSDKKSPGFSVVLKTIPGQRYRLEITGKLLKGDKALITAESFEPDCRLLSKTPMLFNSMKSFEITFQAISDLSVVGIFFHCNNKKYKMHLSKFKVVLCNSHGSGGCCSSSGKKRCKVCHHKHCRCKHENSCSICMKKSKCKCSECDSCNVCKKCVNCLKCSECKACAVCCVCHSSCLVHDVCCEDSSSSSCDASCDASCDVSCDTSSCDSSSCDSSSCSIDLCGLKTCSKCPPTDPKSGCIALCRCCAVQCDYILQNPCPHTCGLQTCKSCIRCSVCLTCSECCFCLRSLICPYCLLCQDTCVCNYNSTCVDSC